MENKKENIVAKKISELTEQEVVEAKHIIVQKIEKYEGELDEVKMETIIGAITAALGFASFIGVFVLMIYLSVQFQPTDLNYNPVDYDNGLGVIIIFGSLLGPVLLTNKGESMISDSSAERKNLIIKLKDLKKKSKILDEYAKEKFGMDLMSALEEHVERINKEEEELRRKENLEILKQEREKLLNLEVDLPSESKKESL